MAIKKSNQTKKILLTIIITAMVLMMATSITAQTISTNAKQLGYHQTLYSHTIQAMHQGFNSVAFASDISMNNNTNIILNNKGRLQRGSTTIIDASNNWQGSIINVSKGGTGRTTGCTDASPYLKWTESGWDCGAGGTGTGSVGGVINNGGLRKKGDNFGLRIDGCSEGQVLKFIESNWVCQNDLVGEGGDGDSTNACLESNAPSCNNKCVNTFGNNKEVSTLLNNRYVFENSNLIQGTSHTNAITRVQAYAYSNGKCVESVDSEEGVTAATESSCVYETITPCTYGCDGDVCASKPQEEVGASGVCPESFCGEYPQSQEGGYYFAQKVGYVDDNSNHLSCAYMAVSCAHGCSDKSGCLSGCHWDENSNEMHCYTVDSPIVYSLNPSGEGAWESSCVGQCNVVN